MPLRSAGILAYRVEELLEVLLVHPGGPYWRNKDNGAWTIPKGEIGPDEDPEVAARREFMEELGIDLTEPLLPLGSIRQRGGKLVDAYAVRQDVQVENIRSNTFELEWPPRSRQMQTFPEVDQARWFDMAEARIKIIEGQRPLLDRLENLCRKHLT